MTSIKSKKPATRKPAQKRTAKTLTAAKLHEENLFLHRQLKEASDAIIRIVEEKNKSIAEIEERTSREIQFLKSNVRYLELEEENLRYAIEQKREEILRLSNIVMQQKRRKEAISRSKALSRSAKKLMAAKMKRDPDIVVTRENVPFSWLFGRMFA